MKNDKQALVPRLRFPDFWDAGEWEVKRLGEVADFSKGKGLPKSVITTNGKNACVHYGELFTEYPEVIQEIKSYTNLGESVFLSSENDVLMPTSDVTPSGLAKACCIKLNGVILGGDILVIRTNKGEIDGEFLARHIRHLEQKVLQLVSGSTVFHLYASSIEKLVLTFPRIEEQQEIADCLSSLDALIATQADKIDALKTHKKGLMQQLFPREGETVPRLRFPDFQGKYEWETIQLQDLSTIFRGASPRPRNDPKFYGGDIPRLMGQDVSRDGKWVTPCIDFLTKEGARLSRFCEKGTLTIICSGDVGIPSFLAVDACIHDGFLALIDIDVTRIDVDYLYYCLVNLQSVFNSSATHGGIYNNLTTTILKEFTIGLPKFEEQNKIANCLSSLDALITAHSEKLDALKTHKKGLMQQLFPSPEAVGV